ncbi:MAG: hypothetical protein HY763_02010 [Planctomycetes bacterium]|nr:hypothetical protein [Planctomycetota bacterium]
MRSQASIQKVVDSIERAVQAGVIDDPRLQSDLAWLAARPDDQRLQASIDYRLAKAKWEADLTRGRLCRAPRRTQGDLIWGWGKGVAFRTPVNLLCRHILITGQSGSGKTNLIYWLLVQLVRLVPDLGVWVFETRRREFRRLGPLLQPAGVDVQVIRPEFYRAGVLAPPVGVDPRVWAPVSADSNTHALGLPPTARFALRRGIGDLYQRMNVFGGGRAPTLRELEEYIRSRGPDYCHPASRLAILEKLGSLLATSGACFESAEPCPVDRLARMVLVFELDSLPFAAQNLIILHLLLARFHGQVARNQINSSLSTLVVFDEASRFFSQRFEASFHEGLPPLSEAVTQIRTSGTGIVAGCQSTSDLSRTLVSGSAVKLLGVCGDFEDYQAMGRHMGMDAPERTYAQRMLRTGFMVIQVTDGPDREPCLIGTHCVPLPPAVTDDEVERSAVDWDRRSAEEAAVESRPQRVTASKIAIAAPRLDAESRRFLTAVYEHPQEPSTAYARLAGLSPSKAIRIRRSLVAAGLLREQRIDSGRRGGQQILLEIQPAGLTVLERGPGDET